MQSKSKIDGYTLARDYSTCIAGRHECNADAEKIVETMTKEEQKKVVPDILMGIMMFSREADKRACPLADSKRCSTLP